MNVLLGEAGVEESPLHGPGGRRVIAQLRVHRIDLDELRENRPGELRVSLRRHALCSGLGSAESEHQ